MKVVTDNDLVWVLKCFNSLPPSLRNITTVVQSLWSHIKVIAHFEEVFPRIWNVISLF